MGYYTWFEGRIHYHDPKFDPQDIYVEIRNFAQGERIPDANENFSITEPKYWEMSIVFSENGQEDELKWYECEKEMKLLSEHIESIYPGTVLELSGDGEDSEDLWRAYFKAGKMQMVPCQFVYDPYDESKLS